MVKFLLTLLSCLLLSIGARAEIVAAWGGQSLCAQMFTNEDVSVPSTPGTYQWYKVPGAWGPVTGAGAKEYVAVMKAQTGQDVYMITACTGGVPLLPDTAPWPQGYWTSTGPNSPLTDLMQQVSASGKSPTVFHFNGGQQDYQSTDPNLGTNFYNGLGWLYSYVLSQWSRTSAQTPMVVWITGKTTYGNSQNVNAAQINFATSYPGARLGPAYYDLTYTDGTHLDGNSYRTMGDRGARLDLKALGISGFGCSFTPRIIGTWRHSAYMLEIITDGSSCGMHSYGNITGFSLFDANWTPIGIVNAWTQASSFGTSIFITSYPTGLYTRVLYQYNQYQPASVPVLINDYSIGVDGEPLAPLPYGIQTVN